MNAFIKFNRGIMKMPHHWQAWILILVAFNLIVPIFYATRLEARLVLAAMVAGMILMTVLTGLAGFTRILALGHVFWIPLLYFLWTRLGEIPADDLFGVWIRALIVLNALALAIDATDVARFISGDRRETVEGL